MVLIREVMDKKVMGLAGNPLPDSTAKRRLALVSAARAAVICLTPGMPPLQRMSIVPRGDNLSRTLFVPQVRPPSATFAACCKYLLQHAIV